MSRSTLARPSVLRAAERAAVGSEAIGRLERRAFRRAQVEVPFLGDAVAEFVDLVELHVGIEVQRRKRHPPVEGLHRQPGEHARILADRPQHGQRLHVGIGLAQDVDAARFEFVEMIHGGRV
jgi:hypothetical protein